MISQAVDIVLQLCLYDDREQLLRSIDESEMGNIAMAAAKNGVSGWLKERLQSVYAHVENSEEMQKTLRQDIFNTYALNQKNISICQFIKERLSENGIEMALLKGAALMTSYYRDITLRPIGDIDIWVDHKDVYRAYDILVAAGMTATYTCRTHVLQESIQTHLPQLTYRGQIIEIHYNLYSHDSKRNPSCSLNQHIISGNGFNILDESMMLYSLTTHLMKNRETIGLRVGWIVDIRMLFDKLGERQEEIKREAKSYNPSMAEDMDEVWDSLKTPTADMLEGENLELKHGIASRLRSMKCLGVAALRSLCEKPSAKRIADIAYDIRHRHYE